MNTRKQFYLLMLTIAFNSTNRNVMFHNISVFCAILSTYASNCYQSAARLTVIGGKEILSKEETTQGDPTSIGTYGLFYYIFYMSSY